MITHTFNFGYQPSQTPPPPLGPSLPFLDFSAPIPAPAPTPAPVPAPSGSYLQQLISSMPRFSVADVPSVLDRVRQRKQELSLLGKPMTEQDVGQVLLDFQTQRFATSAASSSGGGTYGGQTFGQYPSPSPNYGQAQPTSGYGLAQPAPGYDPSGYGTNSVMNSPFSSGSSFSSGSTYSSGSASSGGGGSGSGSGYSLLGAPGGQTSAYGSSYPSPSNPVAGAPSFGTGATSGAQQGGTSYTPPDWQMHALKEAVLSRPNPNYRPEMGGMLNTGGSGSMAPAPTPSKYTPQQQQQQNNMLYQQQQPANQPSFQMASRGGTGFTPQFQQFRAPTRTQTPTQAQLNLLQGSRQPSAGTMSNPLAGLLQQLGLGAAAGGMQNQQQPAAANDPISALLNQIMSPNPTLSASSPLALLGGTTNLLTSVICK